MKTLILLLCLIPSLTLASFTLSPTNIRDKDMMPNKHVFKGMGCTGENISPALEWKDAPKGAKSFLLTVYDPDAPTGSGWWHWTVANIPANVNKIEEGKVPAGAVEGRTDFGKPGYGGACPPPGHGVHRYIFTLYALKVDKLDLSAESSGAMFGFMANANVLEKASFTLKYSR
jgi:Raf kinase inhibitor-like YbhB/YbcL family protein